MFRELLSICSNRWIAHCSLVDPIWDRLDFQTNFPSNLKYVSISRLRVTLSFYSVLPVLYSTRRSFWTYPFARIALNFDGMERNCQHGQMVIYDCTTRIHQQEARMAQWQRISLVEQGMRRSLVRSGVWASPGNILVVNLYFGPNSTIFCAILWKFALLSGNELPG